MVERPGCWFHYFNKAVREPDRELRIGKIREALDACMVDLVNVSSHTERVAEHRRICQAIGDLRILYQVAMKYTEPPVSSEASEAIL